MSALLRLLIAVLLGGLFITSIFYFVASIIGGIAFNPASSAWKSLLAKLRDRVKKRMPEALSPYDAENLTQLSLLPTILKKASWGDASFEGVFSTIYKEPVLVFAGQKNGNTAAILAQTIDQEFIFRLKGKETEVWLNNQPYAVYVDGNLLSSGKSAKLLAKLETDSDLRQWPVLLGNTEAATLTNAARVISPIPRALTLLRDLSPAETQALLVLAVIQGLPR